MDFVLWFYAVACAILLIVCIDYFFKDDDEKD
jgi:hypothetical protein